MLYIGVKFIINQNKHHENQYFIISDYNDMIVPSYTTTQIISS